MLNRLVEVDISTTQDVFQALTPGGKLGTLPAGANTKYPLRLIYRGQGDARWGLVPSILRSHIANDENKVLESVHYCLGRVGAITHAINGMQNPQCADPKDWTETYRDIVRARAQHVGLPTRLLDWTGSPWVALYFAASSAAELRRQSATGRSTCPVAFALFTHPKRKGASGISSGGIRYVEPPLTENDYAQAQDGVFVHVEESHADLLEGLERSQVDAADPPFSLTIAQLSRFCRIRIPIELADEVLDWLDRFYGINGMTMFPGQRGIKRYSQEMMSR